MKKYILIGFDDYYPAGGMDDILGSFDTLEELRQWTTLWSHCHYDNYQVVDRDTWLIIVTFGRDTTNSEER